MFTVGAHQKKWPMSGNMAFLFFYRIHNCIGIGGVVNRIMYIYMFLKLNCLFLN
ncbi:hypothetical protein HDE70_002935 [Pedobacter cryoconitis]|nr:hypothetical protein [Pedobacter cryoconitis]